MQPPKQEIMNSDSSSESVNGADDEGISIEMVDEDGINNSNDPNFYTSSQLYKYNVENTGNSNTPKIFQRMKNPFSGYESLTLRNVTRKRSNLFMSVV